MLNPNPIEPSNNLADQAAQSAELAIKSTQRATNDALESLSGTVQDIRKQASPMLNRASEQASALVQRGVDSVRDTSQHLRESVHHASDNTVNYIKEEPIKSILIAAATGAAIMALISLMSRPHPRA